MILRYYDQFAVLFCPELYPRIHFLLPEMESLHKTKDGMISVIHSVSKGIYDIALTQPGTGFVFLWTNIRSMMIFLVLWQGEEV